MKKFLCAIALVVLFCSSIQVYADDVNINVPTIDKNWFSSYKRFYSPSELPAPAPPAIGLRSFSENASYDYKQSITDFSNHAGQFYVDSFKEILLPPNQRILNNLVEENDDEETFDIRRETTGITAFDDYEVDEYKGLSDEELKWLINNNIISRDPDSITITKDSISIGDTKPLYTKNFDDRIQKSDFLVALHKATYGVIESRPIAFDVVAVRKASKIIWEPVYDSEGYLIGYNMVEGEFKNQPVSEKGSSSPPDRGEYKVRLEKDVNYVMARYPKPDKLFIVSPNVTELYIKSFLDKGILNARNLDSDYSNSKNLIQDREELKQIFSSYGTVNNTEYQLYPAYAPELGTYEKSSGVSHIYFKPLLTTDLDLLWGKRYAIDGNTISLTGNDTFFEKEEMTTMDGLKFIEAILRVTEGDMTNTEAQIVSYKYGANFINSLSGNDKNTVMYLTAKGILNFENFEEYTFLYEPFQKEFAFVLLYRVANSAARKNFSEIQLTDSDNFWIGKGYGSYQKVVKTPNISKIQSYKDSNGDLTVDPVLTSGKRTDEKNLLSLLPSVENARVIIEENSSYALDNQDFSIMDRYASLNLNAEENRLFFEAYSPFAAKADAVSDKENQLIIVEKLIDDPYKYLYDKKSIVAGATPAMKDQRGLSSGELKSSKSSEDIISVKYDKDCDQYIVSFEVVASDATAALQLVDSKLEAVSDNLMDEKKINVVSKVLESGESITLVGKDSLSILDPELQIISDKVLLNRRTGTRAIILEEQNIALVGNEIIEVGEDALMIIDADNKIYYNLDIISSLLSNTALSSISSKDFYSCYDIQPETYKDVYTERGDKISTAIVGQYTYSTFEKDKAVKARKNFINISQLSTGSNTLIKEITKKTKDNIDVTFKVIVEWNLKLPDSSMEIQKNWVEADINPTLETINKFFYTRPSDDMKELQDYWDNNIGISNALANVMYGTNGQNYITCGYLVPNITFLFYVDDGNTEGGVANKNILQEGVVVSVAGEWFQEVGEELPISWVSKFIGSSEIYNKIITTSSSSDENSFRRYASSIKDMGNGYRIIANEGSRYFPDKTINYNWFPAWVHIAFNNTDFSDYNKNIAANGREWRRLTSDRTFIYSARSERRSDGTIFGGKTLSDTVWMLLPSGALYKSIDEHEYSSNEDGSLTVKTRNSVQDYRNLEGKVVEYQKYKYYVSRVDNQYIELISLDTLSGSFDGNTFVSNGEPIEQVGYQTLKERFVDSDEDREDSIDSFRKVSNKLPDTFYDADKSFLVTDAYGGFTVRKYMSNIVGNKTVLSSKEIKSSQYGANPILYHPAIRLSMLGWDVTGTNHDKLVYRRTLPALLFNDLYPTSLSKTVTDTLIAKSVGVIPLEEVPEGSIILFGDIYLYKMGDSYATIPIHIASSSELPRIVNGQIIESDLTRLVSRILNIPVDSNGRVETLINYINKVSLAPKISNSRFLYHKTLIANDENNKYKPYLISKDGKVQEAQNTDLIYSISYLVSLDKGLVCIPVDTEAKTYTLLFTSTESGKNSITSLPYFPEALNFSIKNDIDLEAFSSSFTPLPNQDELKQQFKQEHKQQLTKDIKYWVQAVLCFILAYLMIMCVLVWFALKLVSFNVIIGKIKHPANGQKGVDLIKILTFGIMDFDTEISGVRLFTCMMLLCMLFAVIIIL